MPELPEVETMRRGLLSVVGGRIANLTIPKCHLKPITLAPRRAVFRRRVRGQQIKDVGRIGKRVVLHLESDDAIVFEPRMTGLLLTAHAPDRDHLRFGLTLTGVKTKRLWYWDRRGLGSVRLFADDELQRELGPDRLGPDALEISVDNFRGRFRMSRRAIKVALLDQQAVAGIGNLYASEILHVAGVHPEKKCSAIRWPMWTAIHQAMRKVLIQAIRYEGSTLSDGTYRNALNQRGSYQNHHRVYNRAGELCPSCGESEIRRIVQSQRSTFFCPFCQTKSGRR